MQIFVQAMYSKQELNADSNYVVYTSLINALHRLHPDWRFLVVFPDAESGYKYENDGFFDQHYVARVPQRVSTRRTSNASSFSGWWYDRLFREYAFDAVWCHLPEIAAQIRAAGRTTREPISKPSLVTQHNYVVHDSLPYEFHQHLALMELTGALASDANVFNSVHCENMLFDNAKRMLDPALVDQIRASSVQIKYGTLEEALVPCVDTHDPNDVVIAYNHRLLGHKRWRETFEMFDRLWKDGVRFRVRYMNNTGERVGSVQKYPFVEVALTATRAAYLEALRGCDLNVIHSLHETFCIAGCESMALGQPLIAPDGVTFPEITARGVNGYPYLFKTDTEAEAMTRRLITDAGERRKWGAVLSEHVRGAYGQRLWAERYGTLFENLNAHEVGMDDTRLDAIRRTAAEYRGRPIKDLYGALSSVKVNNKHWWGTQTASMTKLLRLLRHLDIEVGFSKGRQVIA